MTTKHLFRSMLLCLCGTMVMAMSIEPPGVGCYHCAFTPSGQTVFEELAGKSIAVELFYTAWSSSANFPASQCDRIIENGSLPHLSWEPWDYNIEGTTYRLQTIIDGVHDTYIERWAQQIAAWGKPLFLRWAHEMNGTWYPWDGSHNGGATLTGYGDPVLADGPERYVDAWRHIHDIFSRAKATNVTWIWAPNVMWDPRSALNRIRSYYPGDAYVDWVGIEGYNWGSQQSWTIFDQIYKVTYDSCLTLADKPIMIPEFASTENGGDKAAWITDAYQAIRTRYPAIKAVTWFHINKETDWRINSSAAALASYKNAVADPYFLDHVPASAPVRTGRMSIVPEPVRVVRTPTGVRLAGPVEMDGVVLSLHNPAGRRLMELQPSPAGTSLFWELPRSLSGGVFTASWVRPDGRIAAVRVMRDYAGE